MKIRKFSDLKQYQEYFRQLIEQERLAEKQFYLNEIKRLHGQEREQRGRAILHLNAKHISNYLDFKIYRFGRKNMPQHQLKVGDIVLISQGNPLRFSIEGTVSAVGTRFIEVMTKSQLFKASEYRLDLFVNDITYQRMLEALDSLPQSAFPVDLILGKTSAQNAPSPQVSDPLLNPSQNTALAAAQVNTLTIVHGPPGTGKTTTLARIIHSLANRNRILVCAQSNVAVDNLVQLLSQLKIVRIGHPAKIDPNLLQHSIDEQIQKHQRYKKVEKLTRQIENLRRQQQERYQKPTPAKRRGFSDEQIIQLSQQGKSARGLSAKTLKKLGGWLKLQEQINALIEKRDRLVTQIADEILDQAQVVLATNAGAGSDYLKDRRFDVVLLDEGSQAPEPAALIPLIKAPRAILAGDHKQLPPTLMSERTAEQLQYTLFERFIDLNPQVVYMLTIQYRMNQKICRFPSCKFYDCKLQSHESVRNIVLSEIASVDSKVGQDSPVVFFDTQGLWQEQQKADSPSKYNPGEARFVVDLVKHLLGLGVKPQDIGVITPYKDHEELIRKWLKLPQVEVKSVDGFQGREKQVIILSLVRSNPEEQIGFLKEKRRINVAITRAKRKLIIIGDSLTLRSNALLRELMDYIAQNGIFTSVNPNWFQS